MLADEVITSNRSLRANGSIYTIYPRKSVTFSVIRVLLKMLHRKKLFKEATKGSLFVDKVDLQNPITRVSLYIEFV